MPGTQATLGSEGNIPAPFVAIAQALQSQGDLGSSTALQAGSQVLDQNGNTVAITGLLNQYVTVGAGFLEPTATTVLNSTVLTSLSNPAGINPGMSITGTNIPTGTVVESVTTTTLTMSQEAQGSASGVSLSIASNGGVQVATGLTRQYGIAYLSAFAFTYGSISGSSPASITVGSTSGFSTGMQIAAAYFDVANATDTAAIPYLTTISSISGSSIGISQNAVVPTGETWSLLYVVGVKWTNLCVAAVPYS